MCSLPAVAENSQHLLEKAHLETMVTNHGKPLKNLFYEAFYINLSPFNKAPPCEKPVLL